MAAKKSKKPVQKSSKKAAPKKAAPKKAAPKKAAPKKAAPKKAAPKKAAPKKAAPKKAAPKKAAPKKAAPTTAAPTTAAKKAVPAKASRWDTPVIKQKASTSRWDKPMIKEAPRGAAPTKAAGARVCWHDLMTTDPRRAREFYSALMPWKTRPMMMQPLGETQRIEAGGSEVGGIVSLPESEGIASHWMPYVQVKDLNAVIKRAKELGGFVPVPATKLDGIGRFAVIADPRGAHISPIEMDRGMPATSGHQPGWSTWNEVVSDDPAASARFFAGVFGWQTKESEMGGQKYIVFSDGKDDVAGAMKAPDGVAPHWLSYWETSDLDRSLARVKERGGQVTMPPMSMAGIGRFAVAVDPMGAAFALHQPG